MNNLLKKWAELSTRERTLLVAGGVFVVFFLFYTLIWSPLNNAAERYRQDVISNKMLLLKIQEAGPEINSLRSQIKRSQIKSQSELLSVVERAVRKSRVQGAITEIGLGPENTVRLRFDNVSFDVLMSWLIELQQSQGIVAHTFTMERLPEAGFVKAQLTVLAL